MIQTANSLLFGVPIKIWTCDIRMRRSPARGWWFRRGNDCYCW